jgi:hypothetical protein
MRILGARRHLLLLVAPVLIFGTAVEEVASGRITEWATEMFAPEHRASGPRPTKREVAKLAKPDALQSTAPDSSANASSGHIGCAASSAAPTVPLMRMRMARFRMRHRSRLPVMKTLRHRCIDPRRCPAQGFSASGVNPLVLMLLGALGDANGLVTDSSSAAGGGIGYGICCGCHGTGGKSG